MWHYSLVGVPSCPANQSDLDSSSGRGMQLLEEDFAKSLVELPPAVMELKKLDQAEGNVAEWLRWESANRPAPPAVVEQLDCFRPVVERYKRAVRSHRFSVGINSQTFTSVMEEITQFQGEFDNLEGPAFKQ